MIHLSFLIFSIYVFNRINFTKTPSSWKYDRGNKFVYKILRFFMSINNCINAYLFQQKFDYLLDFKTSFKFFLSLCFAAFYTV